MFRWLSEKGEFVVFVSDPAIFRFVQVRVYPGPDLRPENIIEIALNGTVLRTLSPMDLPANLVLPVGKLAAGSNEGAVLVLGPRGGPRQVSVARLQILSKGS